MIQTRRRRNSDRSWSGLIAQGKVQAVPPTTDTGYKSYGAGRLFLPAATNYVANPACVTKWGTDGAGMVFTRETTAPVALPEGLIYCTKLVHTAPNLATIYPNTNVKFPVTAGNTYTLSWYVHVSALTGADYLRIRLMGYIGATYNSDYALTQVTAVNSSFVRLIYTFTVAAGQDGILLAIYTSDQAADTMTAYMTGMQFEPGPVATPYFDGSRSGSSWSGTANASTSLRSASVLSYPAGTWARTQGTVAMCVLPLFDGADDANYWLTSMYDAAEDTPKAFEMMHSDTGWYAALSNLSKKARLAGGTWAEGTPLVLIGAFNGLETVDLTINGTAAVQAIDATPQYMPAIVYVGGRSSAGALSATSYISRMIYCPVLMAAADKTILATMLTAGATGIDLFRFFRDKGYAGTLILPLEGDSTGYQILLPADILDTVNMVFDGCSLTNDTGLAAAVRYPQVVASSMAHANVIKNDGIGGQTIVDMAASAVTTVDAYYRSDYAHDICIPMAGTNELVGATTAADAYTAYRNYCLARKAAGWQVVAVTMPPRGPDAGIEAKRTDYNASIVANWATFADALADVGADATIGAADDPSNVTYYRDGLHMTAAGYAIVAGIVQTAIEGLL